LVVDNLFEIVDYWVTFNEPHVFCMLTYYAGAWPGGHPDMLEAATSALPTGVFFISVCIGLLFLTTRLMTTSMNKVLVRNVPYSRREANISLNALQSIHVLLNPIVGVAHHVSFMRPYGLFNVAGVSIANSMSLFPFLDDIDEKMDFIGLNYYGQVVTSGKITWQDRDKAWYELQKAAQEKKTRPFYRAVNKYGLMYSRSESESDSHI
ncbi:beta-glucosidase-like SFR2, chloroplastic, partial [Tanacetum coccineum]